MSMPFHQPGQELHQGDSGPEVVRWQAIVGAVADGRFGPATAAATRAWQVARGLPATGSVGPQDWHEAAREPLRPQPLTRVEREARFGRFRWRPAAAADGTIVIIDDWPQRCIVATRIPELTQVSGGPAGGRVSCHRLVEQPLQALWATWHRFGLLGRVLTWDGLWAPRYVRGRPGMLSAHAWGTAFDINAKWNWLGQVPAPMGARGSVLELVPVAESFGWCWGGRWGRPDGMHFELGGF